VAVAPVDLRVEYHRDRALGIGERRPRLSWAISTDIDAWYQSGYEVEIDGLGTGRHESGDSVLVAWPGPDLSSRESHQVRVRVWGMDGSASDWSEPVMLEAGLLSPEDWAARWITAGMKPAEGRPVYLRYAFELTAGPGVVIERARLYATSAGVHQLQLNGDIVGDRVLSPGWSAYASRLRYETHDVTHAVSTGDNVMGAVVADGWWMGYLTWQMRRNVYGDQLGLLAQLEITYSDGT
jgi:alpha-L-rhamnosidase